MPRPSRHNLTTALELLYARRNRRAYVNPDPLQCVYRYAAPEDVEVAGLIAAGLAYGRVSQIMGSVNAVFDELGANPRAWIERTSSNRIRRTFQGFRHRWTTGTELAELLIGVRRVVREYGSLEEGYRQYVRPEDETTVPALTAFCNELRGGRPNSLLPDPAKNAACKRLHLYLRWMVRRDEVDPGCWAGVSPATLIVPLDTHMHQIARRLKLTDRNQANLATALDVTRAFQAVNPVDPTKYDFVLTRFGIRPELSLAQLDAELHELPCPAAGLTDAVG